MSVSSKTDSATMLFLSTALTGWMATLLLGAAVSVPYVIKTAARSAGPYLVRITPHYWLGFAIPLAAFLHAWIPMSAGRIGSFERTGLLLATAALGIMLWQVGLGVALRDAKGLERRRSRRLHFCTMVLIAGLVTAHIVLNRA